MNLFLIFLFFFHFPWLLDFYARTLYGMIFEAQKQNLNMTSQTVISWHNFPFSDEDTDVKALVKSWLQSQPEEDRRMLETFLEDHFYKALDWVLKQNEFVVETSLVGVVMNGLSHMHGVKVKAEFACCLIRGLGANLSSSAKTAFAKEVTFCLDWTLLIGRGIPQRNS